MVDAVVLDEALNTALEARGLPEPGPATIRITGLSLLIRAGRNGPTRPSSHGGVGSVMGCTGYCPDVTTKEEGTDLAAIAALSSVAHSAVERASSPKARTLR